jgi:protein involved in polysaccharide export with SLBB domain
MRIHEEETSKMMNRIITVLIMLVLIPSAAAAQESKIADEANELLSERLESPKPEDIESEWEQRQRSSALEGPIDPATYILGPMDRLVLIISGPQSTNISLRVLPEGIVVLPNIGPFPAAGLTLAEFKQKMLDALSRYYRNVDIDCRLFMPRTFNIFVLGEVKNPGPVEMHAPFRLSEALVGAGDRTGRGSMREIEIWDSDQIIRKVDLYSFLRFGGFEHNPTLREGQTVLVPQKRRVAKVVGEVRKPGEFEILSGETMNDLLAFGGGITAFGDEQRLIIERIHEGDSTSTIQFSIDSAGQMDVNNRDVLVVPDIFSFPQSRFVHVVGGGGRRGRFLIQEGETLSDFLPRLWRFKDDDAASDMILERKTEHDVEEYISFNPTQIFMGDPTGGLILQSGDVITIPPIDENVFVTGEVVTPGPVPFRADLRAEEYISMAGGPTEKGGFGRLKVFSKDGSLRDAEEGSMVYRGETIVVKQRRTVKLRSFVIGLGSLSGLVLAIIALTQTNR